MTDYYDGGISQSVQSRWPDHVRFLMPGVNDTWNLFQKFSKGKAVTGAEWKEARQALHLEYQKFLAEGGSPESIIEDSHRFEDIFVNWNECSIAISLGHDVNLFRFFVTSTLSGKGHS